jgi:hypothetical protein
MVSTHWIVERTAGLEDIDHNIYSSFVVPHRRFAQRYLEPRLLSRTNERASPLLVGIFFTGWGR